MEVLKRGTGFGLSSAERHLARETGAISQEMSQRITGEMPVPRYFATPSFPTFRLYLTAPGRVSKSLVCAPKKGKKQPQGGGEHHESKKNIEW